MSKGILFFVYFTFVLALFNNSVIGYGSELTQLGQLIDEALDNNPQIQAAHNQWKAAEYRITQAYSLDNPMAKYSYFGKNIETRTGPQEAKYGASQKLPFPGKLSLKGKAARKQADIFKEKYEAEKRDLIKDIKFIYYDISWLDRAIQIIEQEKAIVENLESVARRKYELNLTSQQDVIKANVELSKLLDKIYMFKQRRRSLQANINSLLNRPKDMRLEKVSNIEFAEFSYSLKSLHEIASESSQELIAANLDTERSKYEKSLAMLDYFPDFTVGFEYVEIGKGKTGHLSDGEDAWMGTVSVNVPIWYGKLAANLGEKKALLKASEKKYQNIKNTITAEIEDLYFKVGTYKDIVTLYKTALIPQTEQAFEASRTAYETGKVDFLNWLDAERVLLNTRIAYYKAIVDYQKSIAYLERVIGREL